MFFKRLEIHGFKSFADPVTIDFDRGITCVVGPNGSGKSNICDAIRWVLGAQSARALRGDKMEDVIFAGTANRRSRGMAEVTLVLDNTDQQLAVEYNEVAITRRMYRSGESEYLINNNRCRMKDVRSLLMDTGIGVEGYSIIGQGKISDIISSNTESIREILEETAGIVTYRSKKEEAQRKLISADANVERVNDIIGELEDRLPGLEKESKKASRYLELRDRHKELEVNITLRHIDDLELKYEYLKDDIMETGQQLDELRDQSHKDGDFLREEEERRKELDRLLEEARSQQVALTQREHRETSAFELNKQKMESQEKDKQRLEEEIVQLRETMDREEENSREAFRHQKEWTEKTDALQQQLEEKIVAFERRQQEEEAHRTSLNDKQNTLIQLQQKTGESRVEKQGLLALQQTLENRRQQLLLQKQGREEGLQETKTLYTKAVEEKEQLQSDEMEAQQSLEESQQRRNALVEESSHMQQQLESIRVEKGNLFGRLRAMEEMEANYEGFNAAVRFIMKQNMDGMDGVVAQLLQVPKGMEIAIETALGGAMQNLVCQDDKVARQGVDLLKKNQAGRATFLPLASLQPRKYSGNQQLEKADGFLGYGSQCVTYLEKYAKIAQYLLGNVVIAETIDKAVAMAKISRSFRIVTLDGEIISQSGAITGGRFKRKSAHIFERKAELTALQQKVETLGRQEAEIQQQQIQQQKKQETLQEEINTWREKASMLQQQLLAKSNEIAFFESTVEEGEAASQQWQRELDDIGRQQQESKEELNQLEGRISQAEKEKIDLETTLESDLDKMRQQETTTAGDKEEITWLRIQLGNAMGEKNRLDDATARAREVISSCKNNMENRRRQIQKLEEDMASVGNLLEQETISLGEIREEQDHLRVYLSDLTGEKKELVSSYEEARASKERMDVTIEKLAGQHTEMGIQQARLETQLENARNKLWEEFDISYMQALEYRKEDFAVNAAVKENRQLKKEIRELGDISLSSIEEYKNVNERYEFLAGQRQDILQSQKELQDIIQDIDKIIKRKFKTSFDQIVENFERVYRELYGGGHARIVLTDPADPFGSDIEITAQPPGKQLKSINLLSGGEKTMTAIALMFAVLKTKPTPCCILDEIEAALDDSNLNIFGRYVRKFSGVQFTLITHQKATMEHADTMYGITMPESGVSRVYSLRMEDPA